jgi:hypothetical protein
MSAPLRVVQAGRRMEAEARAPAKLSDQVRQLQVEAKRLAGEHIEILRASLLQTQQIAEEIAQGGDAYPPGVRDIARRLNEDSLAKAQLIQGIMARV